MANEIRGRRKDILQYDFLGDIYAPNANKVGRYGFPQLQPAAVLPKGDVRGFNYLLSLDNPENYWIHCFVDDYQFERLWTGFDFYLNYIIKARGIISSDFSLYRDYKDDWLIWNCYRNRVIAYALQQYKSEVIPTASFGPEHTWNWCFDGLAKHSVVAVTTNGVLDDVEAKRIFAGGIEALIYTVEPSAIVVCGNYPKWLDTKYPNVRICHIPSFGQQWHNRRCA